MARTAKPPIGYFTKISRALLRIFSLISGNPTSTPTSSAETLHATDNNQQPLNRVFVGPIAHAPICGKVEILRRVVLVIDEKGCIEKVVPVPEKMKVEDALIYAGINNRGQRPQVTELLDGMESDLNVHRALASPRRCTRQSLTRFFHN